MRVLLIAEQPDVLRTATMYLLEEGFCVEIAEDGEFGLHKAQVADYDAIVLDATLSQRSGWILLEELRQHKSTPVLMLTNGKRLKTPLRSSDADGIEFLSKPFMRPEFLSHLQSLVHPIDAATQTVIDVGSLSIDTVSRSVTVNGCEVSLNAKEFSLLELLAMRRGVLVRRAEIYAYLFDDYNDPSLSNLLEAYISQIRRKIGSNVITTKRGIGYMIDC